MSRGLCQVDWIVSLLLYALHCGLRFTFPSSRCMLFATCWIGLDRVACIPRCLGQDHLVLIQLLDVLLFRVNRLSLLDRGDFLWLSVSWSTRVLIEDNAVMLMGWDVLVMFLRLIWGDNPFVLCHVLDGFLLARFF